jgi:hypothetical protein
LISTAPQWRNLLRKALWAALTISALLVAARAIHGPYPYLKTPMNAEGVFALSGIGLLACPARRARSSATLPRTLPPWLAPAILIAAALLAYSPTLSNPFLADDYGHIPNAIHATPAALEVQFTRAAADRFFRPAVFIAYAVEARVARQDPIAWHILSLALHIAVALLVFLLAQTRNHNTALPAALLFLLHGSRPEAVAWVAAQFDLFAALFFLLALLAFQHRHRTLSLLPLFLALLSKESAYVYPLILVLLLYIDRVPRARWLRLAGPSVTLTAAVFLYRWSVLGGIGGYRNAGTNQPYIFTFDLLRTTKALTARLAAVLDFPINWTHPLEWWLILTLIAALVAWAVLFTATADRKKLLFALGFILLAALPVHEFLLIDSNLEKSRVLYLPSVGYALLFAAALEAVKPRIAIAAACTVLAFQTAALEHNLKVWSAVSRLAQQTCSAIARIPGPAALSDISNTIDGVYFLHTGLRGCIEQSAGHPRPDLYLATEPPPATAPPIHLEWNDTAHAYERR